MSQPRFHDPKNSLNADKCGYPRDALEGAGERFHIGQCYAEVPAEKLRCVKCKGDRFEIASEEYFTAVRCPTCLYEVCIHDG